MDVQADADQGPPSSGHPTVIFLPQKLLFFFYSMAIFSFFKARTDAVLACLMRNDEARADLELGALPIFVALHFIFCRNSVCL